MAKTAKNISIKATPGRNERVDPVVRLEDLLAQIAPEATKAVRGRGAAGAEAPGEWRAASQLAAELGSRLRALRGAEPAKTAAKQTKRAAGSAKKR